MICRLFWRTVRLTYPWVPLAKALWLILTATGLERLRAQVRFWRLYSRIDFAELLAAAMDWIRPEYWV